jgi:hypothetical protein
MGRDFSAVNSIYKKFAKIFVVLTPISSPSFSGFHNYCSLSWHFGGVVSVRPKRETGLSVKIKRAKFDIPNFT